MPTRNLLSAYHSGPGAYTLTFDGPVTITDFTDGEINLLGLSTADGWDIGVWDSQVSADVVQWTAQFMEDDILFFVILGPLQYLSSSLPFNAATPQTAVT